MHDFNVLIYNDCSRSKIGIYIIYIYIHIKVRSGPESVLSMLCIIPDNPCRTFSLKQ